MSKVYAFSLIKAIVRVFRIRVKSQHKRGLLLVMLYPFMSARSILDAAETSGVPKRILYDAVDSLQHYAVLMSIRRQGLCRLVSHLSKLEGADSSGKSRACLTLCADDFTRAVRGELGGLAHPCYSGADKKIVYGLRIQALVAVIGEGDQVIILDVRVVPPKNTGAGRRRHTHSEWLEAALNRIREGVELEGKSLGGYYLSVDSAYASGPFVEFAKSLNLKVVSELKANLLTWSWFWLPIPAGIYFTLFEIGHPRSSFQPMSGEPKILYLRHQVTTKVYGQTQVVLCLIGGEVKRFFTTDSKMKALTVRRVAKRRWQLERVFWNSKQLLGLKTIHQETENRVLVRVYLNFVLVQAAKDCSKEEKITVDKLHKVLRRDYQTLCSEIRFQSISVHDDLGEKAADEKIPA